MVAEGEKMIVEGWAMFEETVGQVGMGKLPQLLRSIRTSVTPTWMMKEAKMEEELMKGEEGEGEASGGMTVTPVREGGPESPIMIQVKMEGGGRFHTNINAPSVMLSKFLKGGWTATLGRSIH